MVLGEGVRVLIIEDDLPSATYLKTVLIKNGYEILEIADSGERAVQICKIMKPEVVLVDIMLSGRLTGSETAIHINYLAPECKVIFLTAHAEEDMIDYAVLSRAFGYLMKPYRIKEILATIRLAICNNTEALTEESTSILLTNGFSFKMQEGRLYKDFVEIPLSSKKLKLIELLAKNKNNTVSNEQMCNAVWGEEKNTSTLRSLVHRIKATVGSDIIQNVNGVGYKLLLK